MKNYKKVMGNKGFTLIELVVVIGIIGVLASIAYPAYTDSVNKGRRADAIDTLVNLAGRMEEFYMNNDTYAGSNVTTLLGSATSSGGYYTLSLLGEDGTGVPNNFGYMMKATPVGADDQCGYLTLTSLGVKASELTTSARCW